MLELHPLKKRGKIIETYISAPFHQTNLVNHSSRVNGR